MNASVAMGRVPANARFGHFEFTHERASVFDVCGGVRHQVLLFEGPTPDPHSLSRRHVVESLLSQYAVDITINDVPAAEQALHACYCAHAPQVWLIRPDGHLALLGGARGRRWATHLPGSNLRSASASIGPEGRPIRAQVT